jgi:hypothetical protein
MLEKIAAYQTFANTTYGQTKSYWLEQNSQQINKRGNQPCLSIFLILTNMNIMKNY